MSHPPEAGRHDRDLAEAFDGQAERFERAPVQSDPRALVDLVEAADLADDSLVLDAGCGPGLVGLALLEAGHRVVGVDLSEEMIARAAARCRDFAGRARFARQSLFDPIDGGPFDASISRYVLHHVTNPATFLARQVAQLRPGGVLIVCDHTTDPDPALAAEHNAIEALRDRTHVQCLTSGSIVDLVAGIGLINVRATEVGFTLDFDEWFDRGTPSLPKPQVRLRIEQAPPIRGFHVRNEPNGRLTMHCCRAIVRGVKPPGGPG